MSVAPACVQLTSVRPNNPTPKGTSVSTQPSINTNSTSGNQNNTNIPTRSPTTTNTTPLSSSSSSATSSAQSRGCLPWRRIRRLCVVLAKTLITVACAILTYLAFNLAMWSAAKDYRDDCRNQNDTSGHISRACTEVLHAVLTKPMGLSMFVSNSEQMRRRLTRRHQLPSDAESDRTSLTDIARTMSSPDATGTIIIIVSSAILVFAVFHYKRNPPNNQAEQTIDLGTGQHTDGVSTTWVGNSVVKADGVIYSTSVEADSTDLRRRNVQQQSEMDHENNEQEDEWLPADSSAVEPGAQHIDAGPLIPADADMSEDDTDPSTVAEVSVSDKGDEGSEWGSEWLPAGHLANENEMKQNDANSQIVLDADITDEITPDQESLQPEPELPTKLPTSQASPHLEGSSPPRNSSRTATGYASWQTVSDPLGAIVKFEVGPDGLRTRILPNLDRDAAETQRQRLRDYMMEPE